MTEATATLSQLKKSNKLICRAFHKNGPKSFRRGQGALLRVLLEHNGATQRELVQILGLNRGELRGIVKKAERSGYVTIGNHENARTYIVELTDTGRSIAEKRVIANDRAADNILECLNEEEIAQLNAITEKLIVSMKEKGINGRKKKGRRAHHRCRCH